MPRADAVPKVTGAATYTSDLVLPGMLHAAVARSHLAHGVLEDVDLGDALAVPGAVSGLTGRSAAALPERRFGGWVRDQNILAVDRVRYVGDPIAAVVAESAFAAQEAVSRVKARIVPLPVLGSYVEAMAPDAAELHDADYDVVHAIPVTAALRAPGEVISNICHEAVFAEGDVDEAFAAAAWIHEATYTFATGSQVPMEPHSVLARWLDHERIEVWTGTQEPFMTKMSLAALFDLDPANVRVRVPYVGGAFGAKNGLKYEPLAVALAAETGRPVRLVLSMEESFLTVTTHPARLTMRTAVADDGRLLGRESLTILDAGAYAEFSPRICAKTAYRAVGPYRVGAFRSVARAIYSNRVPAGAYRGFGAQQTVWAIESAMDEIASTLGRDSVEYRNSQFRSRGEPFLFADGPRLDSDLASDLATLVPTSSREAVRGDGVGFATGVKDGGGVAGRSEARVGLNREGQVKVWSASVEFGQGTEHMLTTLVAEEFGCSVDQVVVGAPDTDDALFDSGTNSSRSTVFMGAAAQAAARKLRDRIATALSQTLGVSVDAVPIWTLRGASVVVGEEPPIALAQLFESFGDRNAGYLTEDGAYETIRDSSALGHTSPFFEVTHAAVRVCVDREIGRIDLVSYEAVTDAGKVIDEAVVHGQDVGSVAMGIGHTLMESLEFAEGVLMNGNLAEYAVPRARDCVGYPMLSRFVENGDGPGPRGAKGIAEGAMMPVAPAIANAVFAATGVRIRDLPMTPERVWQALQRSVTDSAEE